MQQTDAASLVALFSDPQVHRFVDDGTPLTAEQADLWVRRSNENHERYGYGTGIVVERSSGNLIGWAGFARAEGHPEEVIYGLATNSRRRGYGTEILKALIDFAEHTLKATSIRATVHPQNRISIRLLCQQGFKLEKRSHGGDANSRLYTRSLECIQAKS